MAKKIISLLFSINLLLSMEQQCSKSMRKSFSDQELIELCSKEKQKEIPIIYTTKSIVPFAAIYEYNKRTKQFSHIINLVEPIRTIRIPLFKHRLMIAKKNYIKGEWYYPIFDDRQKMLVYTPCQAWILGTKDRSHLLALAKSAIKDEVLYPQAI